ncbi:MAG TPA: hypothetical protein VFE30_00565 [Anaeromyxobacteraceae bacterium]|jgi:hypothetical protein|nr:hypothetical protein [Anaeromyxobacteraceae bacterium]
MASTAEKLGARAEELPEQSLRRKVLEGAQRFKSAWVEFGRLLSQVKREALWREWGYPSFDAYCAKELFIRKQTAEKLTLSYGFLERHEPAAAEPNPPKPPPSFEVIEVLSRAEATGRLPAEGYQELRDQVWDAPSAAAVNRQLTERFGPAPRPAPPEEGERLVKLLALARRLAQALRGDEAVPKLVAERAEALAEDIEELVES